MSPKRTRLAFGRTFPVVIGSRRFYYHVQGEAVVGLSLPGDVFFPSAWAVTSSIMISSQIYLPGLVNLLGLEAPESKDQAHGSERRPVLRVQI